MSVDATPLPDNMIKTLVASRNANAGLLNMRQVILYFGYQLCLETSDQSIPCLMTYRLIYGKLSFLMVLTIVPSMLQGKASGIVRLFNTILQSIVWLKIIFWGTSVSILLLCRLYLPLWINGYTAHQRLVPHSHNCTVYIKIQADPETVYSELMLSLLRVHVTPGKAIGLQ